MAGDRTPGLQPRRLPSRDRSGQDRQPGHDDTTPRWRRALRPLLRPSRDQTTSYIAIGAVVALVGTTAAFGVGAAGAQPLLSDVSAWLGNSNGSAVHVNGPTGQVDGRVALPGTAGHRLQVSEDGKSVLVFDERTGKLVRIDPSQLTVGKTHGYAGGLQLVAGVGQAYLVDREAGTVQQVDPLSLVPKGQRQDFGTALGKPLIDSEATLWVPVPARGQVVPIVGGAKAAAVRAGAPNHPLLLTLAAGRPVVTDPVGATLTVISLTGPRRVINLPSTLRGGDVDKMLVPDVAEGTAVPVLAADRGVLVLADLESGSVRAVPMNSEGHSLAAPQVLANRVYVPDQSEGRLIVYDTATSEFTNPIKVSSHSGRLDAFVRNGLLWVNDPAGSAAAVVNASGVARNIGKYDTNVPSGNRKKPKHLPIPDPTLPFQTAPPQTHDPSPTHEPAQPTKDPLPTSTPTEPAPVRPPGTPTARSGSGTITIDFAPAAGARPTGYTLVGAPAGAAVQPAKAGPDGPFTFQVNGGDCAVEYSFRVVAAYPGGQSASSDPSTPVRPCVAPGAPRNFSAAARDGGHGFTLSWDAPENAAGTGVSYQLSWSGGASGSKTISGTSTTVTGLANSKQYGFTLAAANAAGSGAAQASTDGDLTPPSKRIHITNNKDDGYTVGVRSQPSSSDSNSHRVSEIASGATPLVTVHCQVHGLTRPEDTNKAGHFSDIWDKVTLDDGTNGWISDLYVDTSNRLESDMFSPELWRCD